MAVAALVSAMAPVCPLVVCSLVFIAIDFITGIIADRVRVRRAGNRWFFESGKAWRTLRKAGFAVVAITMAWLMERLVFASDTLSLSRTFAATVCGVELWSFLENAATLSDSPMFKALQKIVKTER